MTDRQVAVWFSSKILGAVLPVHQEPATLGIPLWADYVSLAARETGRPHVRSATSGYLRPRSFGESLLTRDPGSNTAEDVLVDFKRSFKRVLT